MSTAKCLEAPKFVGVFATKLKGTENGSERWRKQKVKGQTQTEMVGTMREISTGLGRKQTQTHFSGRCVGRHSPRFTPGCLRQVLEETPAWVQGSRH